MVLLLLLDAGNSLLMWASLVLALGLTMWEIYEQKLPTLHAVWWLLLVFLTHVAGYIALRLWVQWRRRTT